MSPRLYFLVLGLLTVCLLSLGELGLRLAWHNPYDPTPQSRPADTRFHPAGFAAYANAAGLYVSGGRIRFAINDDLAIASGRDAGIAVSDIALGGSTTECGLLPEGLRWPDLLSAPTANYGVSANTSVDGYRNLRYLLEVKKMRPRRVLVMFAVNDLRAALEQGATELSLERWHQPPVDLTSMDRPDEEVLPGLRVRDSALLSFLRFSLYDLSGRRFYQSYVDGREAQQKLPPLPRRDFDAWLPKLRAKLLPARQKVYQAMDALARHHGVAMVLLTQPHAYRTHYQPYRRDLRLVPVVDGKRLTIEQAAAAMALINEQTRSLARSLGDSIVDLATCLDPLDAGKMFYDSVHYTPQGSHAVARCINGS